METGQAQYNDLLQAEGRSLVLTFFTIPSMLVQTTCYYAPLCRGIRTPGMLQSAIGVERNAKIDVVSTGIQPTVCKRVRKQFLANTANKALS